MTKSIETFEFENKFQMVHQKSSHNLPLCSIHLFCDIGSSYETDELRGISHFLEHMMFQGTKTKTSVQMFEQYDRMGTNINAFTTKRYTCYLIKCHEKYAIEVLQLLSDMIFNTTIDPMRIEKETDVIKEEILREDDKYFNLLKEAFESKIYKYSSFEEPIDSIRFHERQNTISEEEIIKWYKWFYLPSNMVMSIVSSKTGVFWKDHLSKTDFMKTYKKTVKPEKALDYPVSIPYDTNIEYITVLEPACLNTQVLIGFRTVNQYSDKKYLFELLTHILNGMSGILFSTLRQKYNLVYSVNAEIEHQEYTGYFSIQTECKNRNFIHKQNHKSVLAILLTILRHLVINGVDEKDFTIARERIKNMYQIDSENIDTFAKYNGEEQLLYLRDTNQSRHHKKDVIIPYLDIYTTHFEHITIDQINQVIREYFRFKNMVISVISNHPPSVSKLKYLCETMFQNQNQNQNNSKKQSMKGKNHNTTKKNTLDTI
jgi:predicted Zn-dependent peptidase